MRHFLAPLRSRFLRAILFFMSVVVSIKPSEKCFLPKKSKLFLWSKFFKKRKFPLLNTHTKKHTQQIHKVHKVYKDGYFDITLLLRKYITILRAPDSESWAYVELQRQSGSQWSSENMWKRTCKPIPATWLVTVYFINKSLVSKQK